MSQAKQTLLYWDPLDPGYCRDSPVVLLQIRLLVVCVKKYKSFLFPGFFRNTSKFMLEDVKRKRKTSLAITV